MNPAVRTVAWAARANDLEWAGKGLLELADRLVQLLKVPPEGLPYRGRASGDVVSRNGRVRRQQSDIYSMASKLDSNPSPSERRCYLPPSGNWPRAYWAEWAGERT